MTAHAPLVGGLAPQHRWSQRSSRRILRRRWILVCVAASVLATTPLLAGGSLTSAAHAAADAAHGACTWGTPDGTTCGEAIVALGYP